MDDLDWLRETILLSRQSPRSSSAFSVGAIVVIDGRAVARGFSRRDNPLDHAEETALRPLTGRDLTTATVYTSLEPCGRRASRPVPCARLLLRAGVRRVVFAWSEPDTFVDAPGGALLLHDAGVEVVQRPELADEARAVNAHLFGPT